MTNTAEPYCKREATDEQSQQTRSKEVTRFEGIVSHHTPCRLTVLITKALEQVLIHTLKTVWWRRRIINVFFI